MRVVAQIIAEAPVRLQIARGVGGARGLDLLLPERIGIGPSKDVNRRILLVRTAVTAAIYRLKLGNSAETEPSLRVLEGLRIAREAVNWLCDVLPGFAVAHKEALHWSLAARPDIESLEGRERTLESARCAALRGESPWLDAKLREALCGTPAPRRNAASSPAVLIWGELVAAPTLAEGVTSEDQTSTFEEELPPAPDASEFEAPPIDDILRIELDEKESEDAVLVHTFEKVETADEYSGGSRDTDGADELEDQLEALEEVDLQEVLRGGEQAHSLLRSSIYLDAEVPQVGQCEPGEEGLLYDEWDARKRAYRKDWCTVYPTAHNRTNPEWAHRAKTRYQPLILELTRRLGAHRSRLEPLDRQPDGEDIDLRAVVDEQAARRAGHGGNQRLYTRRARRRRDIATTLLLDLSLSSDSWVGGQRVLDVTRDAAFVLGEVTQTFGDRIQILAFASHTRNHCRVWEICGWKDSWGLGRARLGALEPQGYTRIGPAIRHATAELAAQDADARLLLVLSDGKPTDYDRYEGRYGIADVRHALREAEHLDISPHALAVDRVACDYLPAMFGPRGWHILPHPNRLPEVLTAVYGRLTDR
jgi:nitric oxide reductase activation protein